MTNETMRHAMAKASGAHVDSPDEVIVSKLEANSDPSLTFHQAWGAAKDLADYHKPDWNRSQSKHESESWTMSKWLEIVRAAPGRVDIRDADRPENPLGHHEDHPGHGVQCHLRIVINASTSGRSSNGYACSASGGHCVPDGHCDDRRAQHPADRSQPCPRLTKAFDDLGLNTPEPAPSDELGTILWSNLHTGPFRSELTVDVGTLRRAHEECDDQRARADGLDDECTRLRSLLATDAEWRRRSEQEPLRSVVAVLLGALGRQELGPTETPHALADFVSRRLRDATHSLARERSRQDRIVVSVTGGIGLVTVSDPMPAATWSSEWPTVPGWYWLRRPDKPPECASVFLAGSGNSVHVVHLIGGGFSYPRERPGVLWGPRIPEPETP